MTNLGTNIVDKKPHVIQCEETTSLNENDKINVKNTLKKIFNNGEIQKILFINPPDGDQKIFNFHTAKSGRYTNFAPYGIGIIAKHLEKRDYETKILNLNHLILEEVSNCDEEKEFSYDEIVEHEIEKAINEFQPDFIGITCMFSMTHNSLKNVANLIRKKCNVPIAAGGVHISNAIWDAKTRLKFAEDLSSVDLFFLFEAELAFSEFIDSANQNFDNIDLVKQVFINFKKQPIFVTSRIRPEGDTLNMIPDHVQMSSSDLSNAGKVGNFSFLKDRGENITTVLSNRGCRAQCTFCSVRSFNGVKVRQRSVQSVIDELLYLRHEQNIKHIMWLDDDLLYNTKRTIELFNEMVKQDVGITWDASNGVIAASVTDEIMSAAEDSGCLGVVIGMESGNPEILRKIRKPGTVKNFIKASEILKNYPKINSRVFLMLGFPDETFGQILDTVNVAKEMLMDWNYITPLQPLPNTPIFDEMVEDNLAGTEAFGDIKYFVGGGYAKVSSNKKNNPLQTSFQEIFSKDKLDKIPTQSEIKIIWAFMNYFLNFEPLKNLKNKYKIEQNMRWMNYVSNIVASKDPIALYYKILVEKQYEKLNLNKKEAMSNDLDKLKTIIQKDKTWEVQMSYLDLNIQNLV